MSSPLKHVVALPPIRCASLQQHAWHFVVAALPLSIDLLIVAVSAPTSQMEMLLTAMKTLHIALLLPPATSAMRVPIPRVD